MGERGGGGCGGGGGGRERGGGQGRWARGADNYVAGTKFTS